MKKTPSYTEDNTRDPRNPPLDPEDAVKLQKGAQKKEQEQGQ
ncbi:MAG TPA: hypothetical protein VFH78_00965 [Candidatus Thermoplasmatota archaeon]|nr:hypothetical protein [Candidatus Thermoplasmatota archaeon]